MINKRIVLIAILLMSLLGLVPLTEATGCAANQWTGVFFNNTTLSGNPAATSCNGAIDFFWGEGSPLFGVHYDNFSARWTSVQTFPSAGTYSFTATVDDGARVYVNGTPIIDNFGTGAVHNLTGTYNVANAGDALTITVDYVEYTGTAQLKLVWSLVGAPQQPPTTPNTSGGGQPWTVQVFNNTTWSGSPVATGQAPANGIAQNWGAGAPVGGVPVDGWSSRWVRVVDFPAGAYTFILRADDGASVKVDDVEILNQAVYANGATFTTTINLNAGSHTLRVEHYDIFDQANLFFTWSPAVGTNLLPNGCNGGTAGINGSAASCGSTPAPSAPTTGAYPLTVTVNTAVLNFRPAPSLNTSPITTVLRGTKYTPTGRTADNEWVQYRVNGTLGWSVTRLLIVEGDINLLPVVSGSTTVSPPNVIPPANTGVQARAIAFVKLRSGPGLQYPRVDGISYGQIVNVVGRTANNEWIQIQTGNSIGWTYAAYYELVTGNPSNIPVTG